MGLDQYFYVANTAGDRSNYFETAEYDADLKQFVNNTVPAPREIAYRRKHPNLHGWMQKLYVTQGHKNDPEEFNGVEVELTFDDIKDLENAIRHKQLPKTAGFFFGNGNDDVYYDDDLDLCATLRTEIFLGKRVFYYSSW